MGRQRGKQTPVFRTMKSLKPKTLDNDGLDKPREREGRVWKCRRKVLNKLDFNCALAIRQLLLSTPRNLKWILLRGKNFKEGRREGRKVFIYGVDTIPTSFRFSRPRLDFRGQT